MEQNWTGVRERERRGKRRANAQLMLAVSPLKAFRGWCRIRPATYLHANLHLQKGPAPYDCSLNCAEIILRLNKRLDKRIDAPEESDGFVRLFCVTGHLIGHYSKKIRQSWQYDKYILYLDEKYLCVKKKTKRKKERKRADNQTYVSHIFKMTEFKGDAPRKIAGMNKHWIDERDGLFCKKGFRRK